MFSFIPVACFEAPPFPELAIVFTSDTSVIQAADIAVAVKRKRSLLQKVSLLLGAVGIMLLSVSYGPSVFYVLRGSERISNLLTQTVQGRELSADKKYTFQPPFNKNLPETNSVNIPAIGVKTVLQEATNENYEEALRHGVWRVNDFGTPYNREQPTILAAHRYGYLDWSLDFRLKQSFFNLPKLEVGDTIEIIWRQRKYTYAVYKSEEGKEITDYSADLILYTCEDLTSEVRVIKYARLLEV